MPSQRNVNRPRNTFERILREAFTRTSTPKNEKTSRIWYRQKAKLTRTSPKRIMRETSNRQTTSLKGRMMIGNMYCFFYDPKLSESLPYYDTFPLVIPIESYSDGFLGLNMHYLSPRHRAILMDALYETIEDNSDANKLPYSKISYETLKQLSKYKYFKPCLKRYLTRNVRSRYLKIEKSEWDSALFLPTERFQKQRKGKVWRESRRSVDAI